VATVTGSTTNFGREQHGDDEQSFEFELFLAVRASCKLFPGEVRVWEGLALFEENVDVGMAGYI